MMRPNYLLALALLLSIFSGISNASEGVFLWKSEEIYPDRAQKQLLDRARERGFDRVYWGINAKQSRNPEAFNTKLRLLMRKLKISGTESWLLLGEPSWIEPEHRHDLLQLVKRFEGLPFQGIMLDLEVEQLGFPVPPERLMQWVDTVRAVKSITSKPVSIAAHWRWFSPDSPVCMACSFSSVGIEDVSLMLYTTNIDRSTKIQQTFAYESGLKFRLAQSIEPTLDEQESWAKVPPHKRKESLTQLKQRLGDTPIDWQAYEFLDILESM